MQIIPLFQNVSSNFVQSIVLESQPIQIRITWNFRAQHFFLHFTDGQGGELQGIKIVPDWLLLQQHKSFVLFDGDLAVLNLTNLESTEITYDNFGTVWSLVYLSAAEVVEWRVEHGIQ